MPVERDDREWAERIAAAYRAAPDDSAAARERLRERLRDEPPPRERGSLVWWIARVTFTSRPIAIAGATLGLLVLGAWLGAFLPARFGALPHRNGAPAAPLARRAGARGEARATFAVVAPGASRVTVVGDFNGWDPQATPLRRAALGDLWSTEVPLPAGLHVYAFVVDGDEWIPDPSAPLAPMTAFGARTSVVVVEDSKAL
jgi:hypothetical protein